MSRFVGVALFLLGLCCVVLTIASTVSPWFSIRGGSLRVNWKLWHNKTRRGQAALGCMATACMSSIIGCGLSLLALLRFPKLLRLAIGFFLLSTALILIALIIVGYLNTEEGWIWPENRARLESGFYVGIAALLSHVVLLGISGFLLFTHSKKEKAQPVTRTA